MAVSLDGKSSSAPIERYEYKYRVPRSLVAPIRERVRRYCTADIASASGPYIISSLYLDSPRRMLYRHNVEKRPRRFKLRVRRYINGPLFLEIKRRDRKVIHKTRVPIPHGHWPELLLCPAPADEYGRNEKDRRGIDSFVSLALRSQAEPAVVVRYRREAFVSQVDEYARVTFDYQLEALRPTGYQVPADDKHPWLPFDSPEVFASTESCVILELKCTANVPVWMQDLAVHFDLRPEGFSKYCRALDAVTPFPQSQDFSNDARTGSRWSR